MNWNHPHRRRDRARVAGVFTLLALLALGGAFFRVQVLASSDYALTARNNRLRSIELPAPRGTIYDRHGHVVADNVPGYAVTILPAPRDSITGTLERLGSLLEIGPSRMERLRSEIVPDQPLVVDTDLPFEQVSMLEERKPEFPGVYIETRPKRRYAGGAALGHVVGHIGEISREQLRDSIFPGYEQGAIIGQLGIERQYELRLQGREGYRYVEVDASRRIVGDFAGQEGLPAEPGEDLRLSLDLELQQFIHEIFPDTMQGAVVALDPEDGSVLALYSAPSFDPNLFVGGIEQEVYDSLSAQQTFYNNAVRGAFAPASTWKPLTAAIALDLGLIDETTRMNEPCTGSYWYGNRAWGCLGEHGDVDLLEAIQHSCNVYFYQVGLQIGLQRLLDRATDLGVSRECGIDLPGEVPGIFPEGPEYWERVFNATPTEGEVLNLSIGQGPITQTPIKMAQLYLAIARDGSAPVPRLYPGEEGRAQGDSGRGAGDDVPSDTGAEDVGPEAWQLDISSEALEAMREGLRRVTGPGGTAWLSSLELWDLMGKTGSGERPGGLTDAWFTGMAGPPGGDPEIVVVALVRDVRQGGGSTWAAPIAAKAADFYLRRKYGLEVPEVQTLREHIQTGPWPSWANRAPAGPGGD